MASTHHPTIPFLTVTVYTRHSPTCAKKNDKTYRRCRCPKYLYINANGNDRRVSARTRSWEAAEKKRYEYEYMLDPRNRREREALEAEGKRVTVTHSVEQFLADAKARNLAPDTISKLRTVFEKQFAAWCAQEGIEHVEAVTAPALTSWRSRWKDGPLAGKKKHERVISFFEFCIRQGWIQVNPANALKKIVVKQTPTDYYTREEIEQLVDSTYVYDLKSRNQVECCNQAQRLRALLLLMRWSGLAIRDAVTLEKSRLQGDKLMLYRAKTGVPVYVPLPPQVVNALHNVPAGINTHANYFFWSANGDPKSAVKDWQRSFRRLFKIANLKKPDGSPKRCFPHMLRDTFAVENLLAGMPIDQVSMLLGHASVTITERHYLPFVRARQQQIEEGVRKSWEAQGIVAPLANVITIPQKKEASSSRL